MKEALTIISNIIINSPNCKLSIIAEEYSDDGVFDSMCKTYVIYEYYNKQIQKFIDY